MYFLLMWLWIAAVSAIDTYFAVEYGQDLLQFEKNPVGVWLIATGGVALLVGCKQLGTSIALGVMPVLYRESRRLGYAVVCGVAAWQLALLLYLVFA